MHYECITECRNASDSPASKDQKVTLTSRGNFSIGGVGSGYLGVDYSTVLQTVVQEGWKDTDNKPENLTLLTRMERESGADFNELDDVSPTRVVPAYTQSLQVRLSQDKSPRTPQSPILPTSKPPHTPPRLATTTPATTSNTITHQHGYNRECKPPTFTAGSQESVGRPPQKVNYH